MIGIDSVENVAVRVRLESSMMECMRIEVSEPMFLYIYLFLQS
jgi:hypothetical protein